MSLANFEFLDRLESAAQPGADMAGIRADDLNALARFLARSRQLPLRFRPGRPQAWFHPWRVTTKRLDEPRAWRIDVAPGVIHDDPPSITYRAKGDPRGWTAPPTITTPIVDRELIDDVDDPPWLLALAPAGGAKTADDFTLRPRGTWPGYFAYEADGELAEAELWRAHVILSAVPLRSSALDPLIPPPALRRFRLFVARRLPAIPAAEAGGWVELATLWLLRRDPADPAADELLVEQQEFWPLWSAIVQPGAGLVSSLDELAKDVGQGELNQLIARLVLGDVTEDVAAAAFVSFWTV